MTSSPALFGFYAAQTLLDARALFSSMKVVDLLDPLAHGQKKPPERHHRLPRQYLKGKGVESVRFRGCSARRRTYSPGCSSVVMCTGLSR